MFPERYSQIFGLGERLGCILNLSHSFDARGVSFKSLVCRYARSRFGSFCVALCILRFEAYPPVGQWRRGTSGSRKVCSSGVE